MFMAPDWNAPFDAKAELAAVPADGRVRGMFFGFLHDALHKAGLPDAKAPRPGAFEWAPMRDYVQLLIDAAPRLHPGLSPREQLRRVGWTLFDDFERTMVGKAIFAVAGRDFARVVMLASKAYSVSYEPCMLNGHLQTGNMAIIELDPVYVLPDSYQVGAWEGAARFAGRSPTIRVDRKGPGRATFEIQF